jgi:hypothetical protein
MPSASGERFPDVTVEGHSFMRRIGAKGSLGENTAWWRGGGERVGPKRRHLYLRRLPVGDTYANEKRREALSSTRRSHVLVPPSQGLEILGQNGLFPFFAQPLGEHFLDGIELESPGSLEVGPKKQEVG